MSALLTTFVPLFVFMMIPIWIPLATAIVGAAADLLRRTEPAAPVRRTAVVPQVAGEHREATDAVTSIAA